MFIKTTTTLTHVEDNRLKRAKGGPVSAGQTYVVGEFGKETFTPAQNGYITPHKPSQTAESNVGDTYVIVKIGERDITDIVDARVERGNRATSRRVRAGSKWGN